MSDTRPAVVAAPVHRPWLDGLRGIAVLMVVAEHVAQETGFWLPAGLGETGVGVFFGLSGYLITGLLLDEQAATGGVRFRDFYLRRAARLLPALVLMLAVSCAALLRLRHPEVVGDAVYTLFYLANYRTVVTGDYLVGFGQAWSLSVEEHFYLLWPAALVFLTRRRPPRAVIRWTLVTCVVVLLWRCVLVVLHAPELLIYHGSVERLDALLYGCAAAVGVRIGWRPGRWLTGAAVVVLLAAVVISDQGVVGMTVVQAGVGLSSAVLVAGLDDHPGPLRRMLSLPPLVWTGLVSYGIYLWHWPILIINGLHHGTRDPVLIAVLGFVVTPAVAALSYHLVERPVRTFVRNRTAQRRHQDSTHSQTGDRSAI